ncbi:MAG: LacI family DNA-binding transcriptional regulator [Bacteroidota bacterium]
MSRKATLQSIADELHIAPSTVSRALTGGKGVSERTRQRVMAVARRQGYVAKIIPAPRSVQVAMLVEQRTLQEKRFWSHVMNGLISEISLHQGILSVVVTDAQSPRFSPSPLFEQVGKIDGIIAIDKTDPRAVAAVRQLGLPVVLAGYRPKLPDCDTVVNDDHTSTYGMANELIRMGHREFGFVGYRDHPAFCLRYEGLLAAMVAAGITDHVPPQCEEPEDIELRDLPTALICGNDAIAVKTINHLMGKGIRIPEDVSVVGFDDNAEELARCPVPLTTLRVDRESLGRWAARTLFQRLNNPDSPVVRVFMATEPVWRQSCAGPRAK